MPQRTEQRRPTAPLNSRLPTLTLSRILAHAHTHAHAQDDKATVHIDVDPSWAPIGAARLKELVNIGFFGDAAFFRVVPNFVVQFGLSGDPYLNQQWEGKTLKDDPVVVGNKAGTLSFAKTNSPNSRTTQVFINLKDNLQLDNMGFAAVGKLRDAAELEVFKRRVYAGYGEQPDQGQIVRKGEAYLYQNFPLLSVVKTAEVEAYAPGPAQCSYNGTTGGSGGGGGGGEKPGGGQGQTTECRLISGFFSLFVQGLLGCAAVGVLLYKRTVGASPVPFSLSVCLSLYLSISLSLSNTHVMYAEPPPKRSYTIWSFDVGKQLVGGAVAHIWNLLLAASFAAATGAAVVSDECAFYAINFMADTFCGASMILYT